MRSRTLIHHKEKVPQEFNKVAARYDLATSLSQGYQADLDRSAAALGLRGDERVLDLCCGTGRSTQSCLDHIREGKVTGIDNSAGMLSRAELKFKEALKAGNVDFLKMDAMHLDLDPESFDAVFAAYGLRNMPDFDAFVKGVHRVMKPGARWVIHDYCLADSIWTKLYWAILGYGFILPFCTLLTGESRIFRYLVRSVARFLSPDEIVGLLEANGFTDVRILRHTSWRRPILYSFTATRV